MPADRIESRVRQPVILSVPVRHQHPDEASSGVLKRTEDFALDAVGIDALIDVAEIRSMMKDRVGMDPRRVERRRASSVSGSPGSAAPVSIEAGGFLTARSFRKLGMENCPVSWIYLHPLSNVVKQVDNPVLFSCNTTEETPLFHAKSTSCVDLPDN